jgi:predicted O-linked N-acetylglucosamine transferase (SPINDLY family)/ADP-heptose:LPS heptosyltransferase
MEKRKPKKTHHRSAVASRSRAADTIKVKLEQAIAAHQQGLWAQANAAYSEILRLDPKNYDAMHFLGVIAYQRNELQEAVDLIGRAIDVNPNVATPYSNRGNALKDLMRLDEALASYDHAIALKPDFAEAYSNRGLALRCLNRLDEALASYDKAIALKPSYAEAHSNRGNALRELNRPDEALANYDEAIALKPDFASAHFSRGNVLRDLKRLDEALASYDRAVALKPDYAEAYSNRGVALHDLKRLEEALASHDRAIALKADFAEAHGNRGNVLRDLKRVDEALASHDRAIALKPNYAEACSNRGNALRDLKRPDEALASYERAIALKPDNAEVYSNRGLALHDLNRLDEALASYNRAIALKPNFAEARWNESVCRLLMGDFESGWKKYEWRWQNEKLGLAKRNFPQPLWLGDEPLEGKTILLHAEQGLGDTIQFCRYAKRVAELGAKVVLEVQPALKSLLASLEGVSQVLGKGEALPPFDYHCPLLSLPLAFKTRLESIPADVPYLSSDPRKAASGRLRLSESGAPRIGLVCSGSATHKNDHNRSIPLAKLVAAMPAQVRLYSLQKDVREADQAVLNSRPDITHFGNELKDFSDTAALISQLDVLISVDTAVAHLAGALGVPVWVLLPFSPDWRWLLDRDDSPWYPSARLFRQPAIDDWASPLARVSEALHALAPRVERRTPVDIDARLRQAVLAHQQGQLSEAEAGYVDVLRLDPKNPDALYLLGVIALQRNELPKAVDLLGQAIEFNPNVASPYFNLGNALKELKRLNEALASYDRAIALRPGYADAYSNRGGVLKDLGRLDEALASYDQAIACKPDFAEAYSNRGNVLRELKRLDEALGSYDRALALRPEVAEVYANRGAVLKELKRLEEALASYERAISLKPDFAEAYSSRGSVLRDLKRPEEAYASCERAISLNSDYAEAYSNRGMVLQDLGRPEAALTNYVRATQINPSYAAAHLNEGICRLLMGDFESGWKKYEWRWQNEKLGLAKRNFPQPLWLGDEPLEGKTILLHAEQGLGDTIQFCRYAKRVAELGAKVVLEVQPALKSLLASLEGVSQVLGKGEALPPFDYHCPLLSLPLAFKTRLESIPADVPYLSSDPRKAASGRLRLSESGAPRIGLVCSGSATHKNDHNRSIPLAKLVAAMPAQVRLYSLQKDVREADQAVLNSRPDITHFGNELKDFSDTAALISQLDVLISVDTAVAHLAGALGVPVWVLLPFSPDWRWLLDRDDSPWYPSARLFRQPAIDDWASPLARVSEALHALAPRVERRTPVDIDARLRQAVLAHQQGQLSEAEAGYVDVLRLDPKNPDALHYLGVLRAQQGSFEGAVRYISLALKEQPNSADACCNLANALAQLNRRAEAVECYDKALSFKPDYFDALYYRGSILQVLGRHDEALASFDKALAINPNHASANYKRGIVLATMQRHIEAIASYGAAVAIQPSHVNALINRGIALAALHRFEEALASYDDALAHASDRTDALNHRAIALIRLGRYADAIATYDRALAIKPDDPDALFNLGSALRGLGRYEEAAANYEKVLDVNPGMKYALGLAAYSRAHICDWKHRQAAEQRIVEELRSGKNVCQPFHLLGISSSPADQQRSAIGYARDALPQIPRPLWTGERYEHKRIRVAYVSADFRDHPIAYLIAGLIELHDRLKFETIGISLGPDSPSSIRSRLKKSFDRFIDAGARSDQQIATLLREMEIDVAVDLMGFTRHSRPGILAHRPAPVQVSYLGYPGTAGASFIDYILADEIVVPQDHQQYFTEKVVYLPDSYLVSDSKRRIARQTPSRTEAELPKHGFVFCCFNNSYKITPGCFDVWMRLLRQVEGSVLWLREGNAAAVRNLQREAEERGIARERLVFAGRVAMADHLARHRLADLFLDTVPYNAHTTASDSLWAGLPVLTCLGPAFAGRVAASLLTAVGLPELITHSMGEYEALALKLATQPALLQSIKDNLAQRRLTAPLFGTDRFRRNIEVAFATMLSIIHRGEKPGPFAVSSTAYIGEQHG